MSFIETVRRARELLEREGRISVRALKREFDLDDDALDELIEELVDVQQVAARVGRILSWRGEASPAAEWDARAVAEALEPVREAERRQLTVLFCDLADSTRLAGKMDPEDWREVVRDYQHAVSEVVKRFEGHVAQYLGDGVLVYFGWPRAHEDDAERAVRAGLGILDAMRAGNASPGREPDLRLAVRIGIHTGPVVVGEMGAGAARDTLAIGDTTHVAARIQAEAEPDTVVMSRATLRLTSGIFVTEDLGARALKGTGEIHLYRALRPSGMRSRLDVAAASGLTPLVGRTQELGLLEDRFVQVAEGLGQAVLVSGEAGIGKSRLVQAFRERIADRGHSWLECRCSPYTQDSALYPVLDLQRQGLGLGPDVPSEVRVGRLETGLERAGLELAQAMPLMARFLGLPLPDRYQEPVLSPESRRAKTLELLLEWLLRLGRLQPMVLLMEDLHWVDHSTQELIGQIVERIPREKVLLLATFRPDFEPPWGARSHLTPMLLARLPRPQLTDLIRRAARGRELPAAWIEEIVRRSDGVPLFAEELTRTVLESHPEPTRGEAVPRLHVPESLQDSLMGRLDALGPVKEIAQLGSVLGREFDYRLLLAVSPLREEELRQVLAVAVREELFYQRGTPPEASFLFKHALLRDAAYESLLRGTRRRHHLRVAETLIQRLPELAKGQPQLVAHHLTEGGDDDRAIDYWLAAGIAAMEQVAYGEAISHLRRGTALAAARSEAGSPHPQELELLLELGRALTAGRGWPKEAAPVWERARLLCTVDTDPRLALYVYHGLVGEQVSRGVPGEALEDAKRMLEISGRADDDVRAFAEYFMAVSLFYMGRFPESVDHFERAMALRDPEQSSLIVRRVGHLDANLYGYAAWAYYHIGRPDRARWSAERSWELVAHRQDPFSQGFALAWGSVTAALLRDWSRAADWGARAVTLATEQSFPFLEVVGGLTCARAAAARGEPGAVEGYQKAMTRSAGTDNRAAVPLALGDLAQILLGAGRPDEAQTAVQGALAIARETGQHFRDAELHRLAAECCLQLDEGSDGQAQAHLEEAIRIARDQEARSLELRAVTSLARLRQTQGGRSEARDLLQPVYDGFSEGFHTPDLKDAEALLKELGDLEPGRSSGAQRPPGRKP